VGSAHSTNLGRVEAKGGPVLSSEDIEENPGTLALAASWVVVFLLILLVQWRHPVPVAPGPMPDPLPVSTLTSHRFGDMTWHEVRQGEPWRLLTATFIHFGLIHLALNGLALLNIGRLIEPWYRTGPFLAICLAIGGLGNLVGGALRHFVGTARPWLAAQAVAWHLPGWVERFFQGGPGVADLIHTGGGSTILLGLLSLAAVVGWRSKTRIGTHLQKQMVILLALTAGLGLLMYQLVDNYGHLGGAIVGGLIGLFDPPLLRFSESRGFRALSWAAVATISLACVGVAIQDDLFETGRNRQVFEIKQRINLNEVYLNYLDGLYELYARSIARSPALANELDDLAVTSYLKHEKKPNPPKRIAPEQARVEKLQLETLIVRLEKMPEDLWGVETAANLETLRDLARASTERPITFSDAYNFFVAWKPTTRAIIEDLDLWKVRRGELERIQKPTR
jgi:membrane associated rhomboid family serine protease